MKTARRLLAVLVTFLAFLVRMPLRVLDVAVLIAVLVTGLSHAACDAVELWAARLARR